MATISGIQCDVELESGVTANFWISTCVERADLLTGNAQVILYGYLNKASYEAGKPYITCVSKSVSGFNQIEGYNAFWTNVAAALLSSHYPTGEIMQAEIPVRQPMSPIPPTT